MFPQLEFLLHLMSFYLNFPTQRQQSEDIKMKSICHFIVDMFICYLTLIHNRYNNSTSIQSPSDMLFSGSHFMIK